MDVVPRRNSSWILIRIDSQSFLLVTGVALAWKGGFLHFIILDPVILVPQNEKLVSSRLEFGQREWMQGKGLVIVE